MLQCELLCVWILSVGLDFTSGFGFYQWLQILLVGLDFTSGSEFYKWVCILPVGLDMKTPSGRLPAISCDLHTTMQ